MSQETSPAPEYRMLFDPIRQRYMASNGTFRIPVRREIGFSIIQKVAIELGNPQDDAGLQKISELSAQKVFEYINTFT